MDLMEFAEKAWYMDWGFINKPLPEITRKWKENTKDQKKYFIIKDKMKKWRTLIDSEKRFMNLYSKNIIW